MNLLFYLYRLYGVLYLLLYTFFYFSMVHWIDYSITFSNLYALLKLLFYLYLLYGAPYLFRNIIFFGVQFMKRNQSSRKIFKKIWKIWWIFFKFENPKHKNNNARTFQLPCIPVKKFFVILSK